MAAVLSFHCLEVAQSYKSYSPTVPVAAKLAGSYCPIGKKGVLVHLVSWDTLSAPLSTCHGASAI